MQVAVHARVDLMIAADQHLNDLMRELALIRMKSSRSAPEPAALADLAQMEAILASFAGARAEARRQADEAFRDGQSTALVVLELPTAAAEAGDLFLAALRAVHELAESGEMLTLPPDPSVGAFLHEWISRVIAQIGAGGTEVAAPASPVSDPLLGAPDPADTLAELAWEFNGDAQAAGRLRRAVHTSLAALGRESLFSPIELPATELVANAVLHTGRGGRLRVLVMHDRVRVEVEDHDRTAPVFSPDTGEQGATGNGLLLVDALTDRWGCQATDRGKTVWFEVAAPNENENAMSLA